MYPYLTTGDDCSACVEGYVAHNAKMQCVWETVLGFIIHPNTIRLLQQERFTRLVQSKIENDSKRETD